MKNVVLMLLILRIENSMASEQAKLLFRHLDAPEEPVTTNRLQLATQKRIPGLSCIRVREIGLDENFNCQVHITTLDVGTLYESLRTPELPTLAPRTEIKNQKIIGAITCEKSSHIRNGVSYDCRFKF